MSNELRPVKPIGLFSLVNSFEQLRDELLSLVGLLPKEECPAVVKYLRAGTIIFAVMEHTHDLIGAFPTPRRNLPRYGIHVRDKVGGRFDVAGGSGILTDGAYYWRGDTADYVEHYRVGLPDEFLRHGRAQGWVPPTLTEEEVLAVNNYLSEHG